MLFWQTLTGAQTFPDGCQLTVSPRTPTTVCGLRDTMAHTSKSARRASTLDSTSKECLSLSSPSLTVAKPDTPKSRTTNGSFVPNTMMTAPRSKMPARNAATRTLTSVPQETTERHTSSRTWLGEKTFRLDLMINNRMDNGCATTVTTHRTISH